MHRSKQQQPYSITSSARSRIDVQSFEKAVVRFTWYQRHKQESRDPKARPQ